CQAEYARARAGAAALAMAQASKAPPGLRDRVLHSAVRVRRITAWYQHPAIPSAIAAALIIGVAGTWLIAHRTPSISQWAASCVHVSAPCGGAVTRAQGVLRFESHGLPRLAAGKVYQAWLLHGKNAPIPEPTFTVDEGGNGAIDIPGTAARGDAVAVTAEPAGGSRAPTSAPILVVTLE
ncbi:MAG TPA: anti-sigma factor, partial [Candidatus Eremiobacteraceae bacterium]|nr:anti-sigma factor [Candidatus Eremiobacteraceae bacterium]